MMTDDCDSDSGPIGGPGSSDRRAGGNQKGEIQLQERVREVYSHLPVWTVRQESDVALIGLEPCQELVRARIFDWRGLDSESRPEREGEVDWPPAQRAGDRFFSALRRKRPDSHPAGPNQIEHPRV